MTDRRRLHRCQSVVDYSHISSGTTAGLGGDASTSPLPGRTVHQSVGGHVEEISPNSPTQINNNSHLSGVGSARPYP